MVAWVGVDVGTQSVRALLVDDDGRELGASSVAASAIDPMWWAGAAEAAIAGCLAASTRAVAVGGVAVASTSGTIVEIDADRRVRRTRLYSEAGDPAIGAEVRDAGGDVWGRLGYPMADDWGLVKAVAAARDRDGPPAAIGFQADHVIERLGGEPGLTDWSHALKGGYDTERGEWPAAVLERVQLDASLLPRVVAPGSSLGAVSRAAADRTGLAEGTPLFAGMTDGCATQVATGALEPGSWVGIIGSTLVVKGAAVVRHGDAATGSYSHLAPDGRTWFPGGASNSGALDLATRLTGVDLAQLTEHLPGLADIPIVYPLHGRGERFPFAAPDAHAFVLGSDTDPSELDDLHYLGGVMVGLALLERLALETVGADLGAAEIALAGGATANPWWNRIRAATMGRPCRVPEQRGAALGAAVLAAAGARADGMASLPAVARLMAATHAFAEADPRATGILAERFGQLRAEFTRRGWLVP